MCLLLVLAFQRSTENVAEGGAGVRGTVLSDGFFFFGDFQGLDRKADAAGLLVELGDAGGG